MKYATSILMDYIVAYVVSLTIIGELGYKQAMDLPSKRNNVVQASRYWLRERNS